MKVQEALELIGRHKRLSNIDYLLAIVHEWEERVKEPVIFTVRELHVAFLALGKDLSIKRIIVLVETFCYGKLGTPIFLEKVESRNKVFEKGDVCGYVLNDSAKKYFQIRTFDINKVNSDVMKMFEEMSLVVMTCFVFAIMEISEFSSHDLNFIYRCLADYRSEALSDRAIKLASAQAVRKNLYLDKVRVKDSRTIAKNGRLLFSVSKSFYDSIYWKYYMLSEQNKNIMEEIIKSWDRYDISSTELFLMVGFVLDLREFSGADIKRVVNWLNAQRHKDTSRQLFNSLLTKCLAVRIQIIRRADKKGCFMLTDEGREKAKMMYSNFS